MEKIYEVLLICTAALGLYVSFVLLFISKHNRLLNRLLATFSLSLSLFYMLAFCISRKWSPDFVILIRTFLPLFYILPASSFLYFKTYIQDDTRLNKKDLLHLLPLSIHIIYTCPLIYALLTGHIQWESFVSTLDKQTYFYNYGPIPNKFHVIFRLLMVPTYLFLIWKSYLSKNYRKFVANNQTLFPYSIRWINFHIIMISILGCISFLKKTQIFYFGAESSLFYGDLVSMCLLLSFDFLIVYSVFNPVILFGLPHFTRFMVPATTQLEHNKTPQPLMEILEIADIAHSFILTPVITTGFLDLYETNKTDKAAPNEEETNAISLLIKQMEAFISTHQPFRQEDFNIAVLSKAMNVPQHHIAYIFKHVLKKSFVDYRNEMRVKYVISSLRKGMHKDFTFEAIGNNAGFTSRSTFFSVFKKHTEMSPMQYLENLSKF
jgi:AraC-like DNA-binding protein